MRVPVVYHTLCQALGILMCAQEADILVKAMEILPESTSIKKRRERSAGKRGRPERWCRVAGFWAEQVGRFLEQG